MKCIYFCVRLIVIFLVSVPEISQPNHNPTDPEPPNTCKGLCGLNTNCEAEGNFVYCSCKPGFKGDAFTKCVPKDPEPHNTCKGLCGLNTNCEVEGNFVYCSCKPGFKGDPWTECVPRAGHCKDHEECPDSKACIKGRCTDPCEGRCGGNTICTVHSHFPGCTCKGGYNGDPIFGCSKQEKCTAWNGNGLLTRGKRKFYIGSEKTNWMQALAACGRNNSRLATVESMEEIKELNELTEHTEAWTSGTDQFNLWKFKWASTGKPVSKELWMKRPVQQPDNHGGHGASEECVAVQAVLMGVYNPGLNDRRCYARMKYLCEYYE